MIAVVALLAMMQSGRWAPDERVLISDFSHIHAVAASPFTLFAATPRGLLVYDRMGRRWGLPVTVLDGYPRATVRVALADATDDAVWLGTSDGWARYDARLRQWQSGPVAGGVTDLALDPQDAAGGLYVHGAFGGWTYLPRGALIPFGQRQPPGGAQRPLELRTALAQAPQADALRALLLTDARLRTYQFTAAARSPDQTDLFLGTNGLGVIRVDAVGAGWDALPFGLPGAGAAALALAPDGVWVGAVPRVGERDGLAWIGDDLAATRWLEGPGTRGLGFREARRLVARPGRLWVVTERGVSRVDPASGEVVDVPVEDATAIAPAPDGVWVGTRRGLVAVTDSGRVVPLGVPGAVAVLSLCAAGDSVWVGTSAGLALFAPGVPSPGVPAEAAGAPGLNAPIVALARLRDTLVAATPDQLAWRAPQGQWTLLRPRADLGRLTTLVADGDGVWVGGAHGLAFWRVGSGTFRALRVPSDLPAGVRDVAVAAPYLWVATDSGVVRFHREAAIDR